MRIEKFGAATLYLGDCLDVLATLPKDSVDLIWTDPPYGNANHDGDFNAQLNKYRNLENQPILNDDLESMRRVVDGMLIQASRVLAKVASCCCCCTGAGPNPIFAWLALRMDEKGLAFFHSVIWDKKNPGIGWRYRRQHEMIMVAHRADGTIGWGDDNVQVGNVIAMMPPRERQHPNEKPLPLMESFIAWHTRPDALVVDPFMGSGSTGVAALKLNRRFIGVELDPKHFDTACRRIEEASKQDGLF